METQNMDPNDPDRHLKRLAHVMGVSKRIQSLALKKRRSVKVETKEELTEKILKNAKEERSRRNLSIGLNERYILEIAAFCFGVDEELIFDCAADSSQNIKVLSELTAQDGSKMILIQYQLDDPPGIESGRYSKTLKGKKIDTVLFTNGKTKKIIGKSLVAYRLQNSKSIDPKTVAEEIFFTMLPADKSVISSIFTSISKTLRPSLEASKEYENCSESHKMGFLYGVDHFLEFLRSTKSDITDCTINFEVNHNLYKGFLLAPHQIEATSKRRDKVAEVEKAFTHWMKQIKSAVAQGHQMVKEWPDDGPLKELEHWRKMLTKFNNVIEFTDSRPFQSFFKCLKFSRSKLTEQWKTTEDDLILLLIEARDNVRFMSSLEKYWAPLYQCEPTEIAENIMKLLHAIRTVYKTSRFYNTPLRISGLLSKIVNQLIVASQKYLTNKNKISIWNENMKNLVKKLHECKMLKESFRSNYQKVVEEMEEAGEKGFECSETYLFERMKSFEIRLNKIREIMEICLRYRVLDSVKIAGTETFAEKIRNAFKAMTEKPYDPLSHRLTEFETDYEVFQKEVNNVELRMQAFVKIYIEEIETTDMRLMTLKRFERLNLDCLCLDHRYLDIAVMLEKEIESIKDKYNEERANPPIARNVPPLIGRILWSRSLLRKIEEPLNVIKTRECVISHPKAQLCVKYYNNLAEILFHYEAMHHKAWFTYASQVRTKLEAPLITKGSETNHYKLNLDLNVLQVVKETESMFKLGLAVPDSMKILTYCKHRVIDAYEKMKKLIARNDNLRRSIYPMFVPLMRIQLIKVERIFKPALSTVTWLALNLDDYFEQIANVLLSIENFIKEVSDINDAQLEIMFHAIESQTLIHLPENAVSPYELKELNITNRQDVEKKIKIKSLAAENAVVDLINKFVENSGIPDYDESGKFQLPPEKINEDNWRVEELKPIDKYDWLSFEKIYKAVGYAAPEENEQFCFKDYDGLKYDVTLLHIDCVELFAYYNHKIIAALAKCTKRSMELLKKRSNISGQIPTLICGSLGENSLMKASIELRIPKFVLVPSMQEIQKFYDATLLNIIETHYAVPTWGPQAKTEERKKRKPLLEEVRHEKNWFKMISEHKEVSRYKIGFDNGVMELDAKVNSILSDFYNNYNYLWNDTREAEIESFVKTNPLTADIRDKLNHYNNISETIGKLDKVFCVRTIEINCEHAIDSLVEESKSWKSILGVKLNLFYRTILNEMVDFMKTQQRKLRRSLVEIDDYRIVINCLKDIRENFIRIDRNLNLLEEVYAMFAAFQLNVSPEDSERVDGLRYQFNTMTKNADAVDQQIQEMPDAIREELEIDTE